MKNWSLNNSAKYLGIGVQLAATILLGVGGGYWADRKAGTIPLFTLVGAVLAFVAGFYNLLSQLKNFPDKNDPK